MKEIKKGFVYSEDIKRILEGVNAFDYQYASVPSQKTIYEVRKDFASQVKKIFNGEVTCVTEEEMLMVNNLIGGGYPHCYAR